SNVSMATLSESLNSAGRWPVETCGYVKRHAKAHKENTQERVTDTAFVIIEVPFDPTTIAAPNQNNKLLLRSARAELLLLASAVSFRSILDLRFLHALPLHVGRNISAATFERDDVIDNVALPTFGITRLPHEVCACRGAVLDFLVLTIPYYLGAP